MNDLTSLELKRQKTQIELDGQRSHEERNKLGQFATPPQLAREITQIALNYLGNQTIRFLEPSIGSGSFFSALLHSMPKERLWCATGIEIDPLFAQAAKNTWEREGIQIICDDFTKILPPETTQTANLILANPPYARHHHLHVQQKKYLKKTAEAIIENTVSGLSSLYIYFIILAHHWMSSAGVGAWLVPSEWMDVNYGIALKEYLCTKVQLLRVHRFDINDVQFRDSLVSSSLIFFRKLPPLASEMCELTVGPLARPSFQKMASLRQLRLAGKWAPLFCSSDLTSQHQASENIPLSHIVEVKRGIATGSNEFFIRPRAEFKKIGIPDQFLRPILPSARYIKNDIIEHEQDGFPVLHEPLALLDCLLGPEDIEKCFPSLWSYLESPAGQKARQGYLARCRKYWYSQEHRPTTPIIATYMGRIRKNSNPFRFFWNKSNATATNVFLLLIPKNPLRDFLQKYPQKTKTIIDFMSNVATTEIIKQARTYGGGLYKIEPKELGQIDVSKLILSLNFDIQSTPQKTNM